LHSANPARKVDGKAAARPHDAHLRGDRQVARDCCRLADYVFGSHIHPVWKWDIKACSDSRRHSNTPQKDSLNSQKSRRDAATVIDSEEISEVQIAVTFIAEG